MLGGQVSRFIGIIPEVIESDWQVGRAFWIILGDERLDEFPVTLAHCPIVRNAGARAVPLPESLVRGAELRVALPEQGSEADSIKRESLWTVLQVAEFYQGGNDVGKVNGMGDGRRFNFVFPLNEKRHADASFVDHVFCAPKGLVETWLNERIRSVVAGEDNDGIL